MGKEQINGETMGIATIGEKPDVRNEYPAMPTSRSVQRRDVLNRLNRNPYHTFIQIEERGRGVRF
ncbi:MAG: hypothetical protein OCU22_05600 [Canidatus Methanoxibalbensis ujae]|nr:hypothetical protein [Candidatus Methanoxibalbensis ujae]